MKGLDAMKPMSRWGMFAGGIVSAAILFVISGIVNGAVLGEEWKSWQTSLGSLNHAPSPATGMILWSGTSLLYGFSLLWVYSIARVVYGAGPRTAAIAGLIVWVAAGLTGFLGHMALDDIPQHIALLNLLAYFPGYPLAAVAGAYFYREKK